MEQLVQVLLSADDLRALLMAIRSDIKRTIEVAELLDNISVNDSADMPEPLATHVRVLEALKTRVQDQLLAMGEDTEYDLGFEEE